MSEYVEQVTKSFTLQKLFDEKLFDFHVLTSRIITMFLKNMFNLKKTF